ncbi:MAG: glycogen debranching N-terminal domain-containing protein [Flavisolibacter sp.]
MLSQNTILEESKYHISSDAINWDDRTQILNNCDTFGIFDRLGNIYPHSKKAQGIFHEGTRYINSIELLINGVKPLLLGSSIRQDNDVLSVDLTNPALEGCDILENSIHISRAQIIRNGIYHEEISVMNYNDTNCQVELSFSFGADFRDIFEIRGTQRNVQTHKAILAPQKNGINFSYMGLDNILRRTEIIFPEKEDLAIENNTARFVLSLKPNKAHKIEYTIYFKSEEEHLVADIHESLVSDYNEIQQKLQDDLKKRKSLFANVITDNEQFNHWINRSSVDLHSLLSETIHGLYPYAGVPWYNTAFGRDGIITTMEILWLAPAIARDALYFLSKTQATELIAAKDAEPGKIIHEVRRGEMANTGEVPFKEYYGTIDATPLFLILAGMYYKRTADFETIKELWPNIKAAIEWINNFGDIDSDGFVEYQHKAENGLTNQGWKDSHDSIMHANGTLADPPIALSEVQGYVFAAKEYTSVLAKALGEIEYAKQLEQEASDLKKNFNEKFWDKDLNSYVLALDGDKKPCKVVSSNPGHCLFTGIVEPEYAEILAKTLLSDNMFSGWGIRTLSAEEVRFNPMSYHNGSVWPHDNALIAYGLAKYGFRKKVLKIMQGLFDASLFIDLQRLPELFCGFDRRKDLGPTDYPVACSPQAWSVGAVFMVLQACLQMEIDATTKTLVFNKPQLPDYLEKITITQLRVDKDHFDFEIYRNKHDVGFHVSHKPDSWELLIKK